MNAALTLWNVDHFTFTACTADGGFFGDSFPHQETQDLLRRCGCKQSCLQCAVSSEPKVGAAAHSGSVSHGSCQP